MVINGRSIHHSLKTFVGHGRAGRTGHRGHLWGEEMGVALCKDTWAFHVKTSDEFGAFDKRVGFSWGKISIRPDQINGPDWSRWGNSFSWFISLSLRARGVEVLVR